jgi:beta-lactamase regulating signal transducer with metallopeptidase domain
MAAPTEIRRLGQLSKHGFWLSVPVALVLLILPFKSIILDMIKVPQGIQALSSTSPFWQDLVKRIVANNLGNTLQTMLPFFIIIGGGTLLVYSVVFGYLRTYRALDMNSSYVNVEHRSPVDIAFRSIALRSLVINIPVIYWAIFLFVALPRLVQLPINSISTGSIPILIVACVFMVAITVAITHIGIVLARLSMRFITRGQ